MFGLHRRLFEQSPYFWRLIEANENKSLIARGSTFLTPLPFDNLPESLFTTFLHLLYDEENFTATEIEWHALKRLATDWQFAHQTTTAVWAIVSIRERRLPVAHRQMLEGFMVRRILEERARRWRQQRRLQTVLMEDDDEYEDIVSDDSV